MAMPSADSDELAKFGYKQELDRSLGLFSSFAAGFSYISIMTGVFELFFFGFGSGGPAFIWTWPAVFAGQMLAPQISAAFEIIGTRADIGEVATPGGAKNALLLAAGLVVFTTIINMIGVKLMARINNFGVMAELIGVTVLIILLAVHIRRGPGVIFDTFG